MSREQYTVYCAKPAGELTPQELTEWILSTDLRAVGQSEGIDSGEVESALEEFVIENTSSGFNRFRICYLPGRDLPIDVDHWQPPVEAISILVADLQEIQHPALGPIQKHLNQTVSVVEVSFGDSSREAMAQVIARSAAVCIATLFGGIVREPDQSWWSTGDGGYQLIEGSPSPPADSSTPTLRYASPKTATASKSTLKPRQSIAISSTSAPRIGWNPPMPVNCPSCRQPLFTRATRPHPRFTLAGKLVVGLAALTATITYLFVFFLIRLNYHIPSRLVAFVVFPFAIAPGVAIGLIANKLPKTFLARCRKCGWQERFVWKKIAR